VAEIVFQGPAALTLDGKGRIAFPARHRPLLDAICGNQLTITCHPGGQNLLIYPRPTWESFRDRLNTLPMDADHWRAHLIGNAMDVEIDASSRLLIAPELRDAVGLEAGGKVMLRGVGPHFELWDMQRLAEHSARVASAGMPDAIKAFR
jgi:MraZ protein